ncbi:LysE/ArgO family amino acid transporter [Rhizobacter sp. P5_C2]
MTSASSGLLFFQSLLIGLSIAAPVGPIGLLTIQRTLDAGWRAGLATGLGAAAADTVYGAVGAFGATALIAWLVGAKLWLAVFGGLVLLRLAWSGWHQSAGGEASAAPAPVPSLWTCFATTFALTLSNPMTIVSFIAIFGAMSAQVAGGSPWVMVAGVLVGSALWWLVLSVGVGRLRHSFRPAWRRAINRASALLLAGFALWQWGGLLTPMLH